MNKRITILIEELKIKKSEFAKRLNVSAAFVSELCSGAKNPSARTITDICREFSVREEWLRTGEGKIFIQASRGEEIKKFMNDLLADEKEDVRYRFVSALAQLNTAQWEALAKVAENLIAVFSPVAPAVSNMPQQSSKNEKSTAEKQCCETEEERIEREAEILKQEYIAEKRAALSVSPTTTIKNMA